MATVIAYTTVYRYWRRERKELFRTELDLTTTAGRDKVRIWQSKGYQVVIIEH